MKEWGQTVLATPIYITLILVVELQSDSLMDGTHVQLYIEVEEEASEHHHEIGEVKRKLEMSAGYKCD